MTRNITFLSGGVGGARFARALHSWNEASGRLFNCTAIVNVGDDFTHMGLRISPDLDSVAYHLADMGDKGRGWGRASDSTRTMSEISRVLPEESWFQLGDLDIAHSLMRTQLLEKGHSLSETTHLLNSRYGVSFTVLPATDDPSPTIVEHAGSAPMGFQEWWVRNQASPPPTAFTFPHAADSRPAPGVLESLAAADIIVIAPSNPVVSIDPILAIPGIRAAIAEAAAPVIGLSPIIGGRPVRGWLDRCLAVVDVECAAPAVAARYGDRSSGGLLDAWLADPLDENLPNSFAGLITHVPLLFSQDEGDNRIIDALMESVTSLTNAPKSGLSV